MGKVSRTYSLDEEVVKRLEEAAKKEGLNLSAYLTTLINKATLSNKKDE